MSRLMNEKLTLRGPSDEKEDAKDSVAARVVEVKRSAAAEVLQNKDLLKYITNLQKGRKFKDWYNGDLAAKLGYLNLIMENDANGGKFRLNDELDYTDDAITLAAGNGHFEVVKYLVKKGLPCTEKAFDAAAGSGSLELMSWLAKNVDGTFTDNAYELAAKNGHLKVLLWLYENDFRDCDEEALYEATRKGHLEILKWLVVKFPLLLSRLHDLRTQAIEHGHLEVLKWLTAEMGVTWKYPAVDFATAIKEDRTAILDYMYEILGNCFENTRENGGLFTAAKQKQIADEAALAGNLPILQDLYRKGIVPSESQFQRAISNFHLPMVQWLQIEKGLGNGPFTQFRYISKFPTLEFLKWVIEDFQLITLLNIPKLLPKAIVRGNYEIVKWLVETHHASLEDPSLLVHAANSGNILLFEYLISKGAPLDKSDKLVGNATSSGKMQMAEWLIKNGYPLGSVELAVGAPVEFLEKVLQTGAKIPSDKSLAQAIEDNNLEAIKLLFKYGIKDRFSAHVAAILINTGEIPNFYIIKFLLKNGVKIDKPYILDVAAKGKLVILQYLLKNFTDKVNYQELFEAAADHGHLAVAKWIRATFPMVKIKISDEQGTDNFTMIKWLVLNYEGKRKMLTQLAQTTEENGNDIASMWLDKYLSRHRGHHGDSGEEEGDSGEEEGDSGEEGGSIVHQNDSSGEEDSGEDDD